MYVPLPWIVEAKQIAPPSNAVAEQFLKPYSSGFTFTRPAIWSIRFNRNLRRVAKLVIQVTYILAVCDTAARQICMYGTRELSDGT